LETPIRRFKRFLVDKLSERPLSGGQGVSSSNLLVPTPIQSIETLHCLRGFLISVNLITLIQTYSILVEWRHQNGDNIHLEYHKGFQNNGSSYESNKRHQIGNIIPFICFSD